MAEEFPARQTPDDKSRAQRMLDCIQHGLRGSGCLAEALEVFSFTIAEDAGVGQVSFDRVRRKFEDDSHVLRCSNCEYALGIRRDISTGPRGFVPIYPLKAYELTPVEVGDCEKIDPLEKQLGSIGLLHLSWGQRLLRYVPGLGR